MNRPYGKLLGSVAAELGALSGQRPELAPVAGMMAGLVALVAADVDDHVARSLAEVEQLRAIFGGARSLQPPLEPSLLARVEAGLAWAPAGPDDYRRERLDAAVAGLRATLIALQAALEASAAESTHAALLDRVWRLLRAQAIEQSRGVVSLW